MVTTELPDGAHVVVLHRWRDGYAHYEKYVDHSRVRVTYRVTDLARDFVPAGAAASAVVDLGDLAAVRAALAPMVRRFGTPAAVIALQEGDLPMACQLRADFDAPGRRLSDLRRFIDKGAMAEAVAGLGIPFPRSRTATGAADVLEFAREVGWPLVAKPLRGWASRGVRRLDDASALAGLDLSPDTPMLVQEYIAHPVHHVDGYFDGTRVAPWKLARYVNVPDAATSGPLAFTLGEPTGEVEVTDPEQVATAARFLDEVIPRLSAEPWVFHLELFMGGPGADPRCVFLEVGCRPGGGEIPFLWRENYGVDLMAIEFALQCGQVPEPPVIPAGAPVAGSLLVPLTGPRPCEITSAPSMVRPGGPYVEAIPKPGTVVPAVEGTYEHVAGRFRFRAASTSEVERAILDVAAGYRVESRAVEPVGGGSR